MAETASRPGGEANPHLEQGLPYEWDAWEVGDEQLIAYDVSEGTIRLYRIVSASRLVRAFASADAALYEGYVVDTYYDKDTKNIEFIHEYAGRKGSHRVEEHLENPAFRLEKLSPTTHSALLSSKQ